MWLCLDSPKQKGASWSSPIFNHQRKRLTQRQKAIKILDATNVNLFAFDTFDAPLYKLLQALNSKLVLFKYLQLLHPEFIFH